MQYIKRRHKDNKPLANLRLQVIRLSQLSLNTHKGRILPVPLFNKLDKIIDHGRHIVGVQLILIRSNLYSPLKAIPTIINFKHSHRCLDSLIKSPPCRLALWLLTTLRGGLILIRKLKIMLSVMIIQTKQVTLNKTEESWLKVHSIDSFNNNSNLTRHQITKPRTNHKVSHNTLPPPEAQTFRF
jgi:hypothetical protein